MADRTVNIRLPLRDGEAVRRRPQALARIERASRR